VRPRSIKAPNTNGQLTVTCILLYYSVLVNRVFNKTKRNPASRLFLDWICPVWNWNVWRGQKSKKKKMKADQQQLHPLGKVQAPCPSLSSARDAMARRTEEQNQQQQDLSARVLERNRTVFSCRLQYFIIYLISVYCSSPTWSIVYCGRATDVYSLLYS